MNKKYFSACLSFFILLSSAKTSFAKTVSLPVTGIPGLVPYTADISLDWDEGAFGKKSAFSYNHSIARMAAVFSDNAYVDVLAKKDNPLYRTYKTLGVQDSDIFLKYNVDYNDKEYGINQCAFSIASKTISSAQGPKTLVFLIIRGTPLGPEEWISNLNINNSHKESQEIHEGFSIATQQVLLYLDEYIKKHNINTKNSFILITGHSRGASVANLCSVYLADSKKFLAENIYAYTFAAPNVTPKKVDNLSQYKFIWNIVNAEDVVPTMPPNRKHWTFQKYGNILTLTNAWNTNYEVYRKEYLPKMNFYFRKFYGEDYSPFKTGPFIPILITKFLTSAYPEMGKFYDGFLHPHNSAERFIKYQVFSGKTPQDKVANVLASMDKAIKSDDKLEKKALLSSIHMHTMETYLCWLLALDEKEVFSKMNCELVRLQGHVNCSVLNEKDEIVLRIENSKVIFSSIKFPVIAFSKSINTNFIGFPKNANYKILVSSDSLLDSAFQVEVENYSAEGIYLDCSKKKEFFTNSEKLYEFSREKDMTQDFPLAAKEFTSKEAVAKEEKYDLRPDKKFLFRPEVSWDSNNRIMLGARIGTQQIFGSFFSDFNIHRFGNYLSFWTGVGSQKKIYTRFYVDAELLTNFVYVNSSEGFSDNFNLVPAFRFSAIFRPRSNKQLFVAGLFEFNIEDFNDGAFESDIKRKTIPSLNLGSSVKIYPSIQTGVRF